MFLAATPVYDATLRLMVNMSTSASQPKPSAAGLAFVTGLAILANPRGISARTIVVDALLFLGPKEDDVLIGSLRYFNSTDVTFEDGPNIYSIGATVSILLPVSITIY